MVKTIGLNGKDIKKSVDESDPEFEVLYQEMAKAMDEIDKLPEEEREEFMESLNKQIAGDEDMQNLFAELYGTMFVGIGKTPAGYAIAGMEDDMVFALWFLPDEGMEALTDEQKHEIREIFVEKNQLPPMVKVIFDDAQVQAVFDQIATSGYEVDPDQLDSYEGTDFEVSVWKELLNIPSGETISYSELAERIGNPKATRAVANAVGDNPLPWIVPCHRVIEKSGDLGGYAFGIERKQKLLEHEANKAPLRAAV